MPLSLFGVILCAAALHAAWNAVVKRGSDKLLTTVLVTLSAALIALVALPFLHAPARASWPYIAASTLFQTGYFVVLAWTYRVADMSLTYPIMRGIAPLLVALAGLLWLGELLSVRAWTGLGVLCLGILSMVAGQRHGDSRRGIVLALLNALIIASYTLIDGVGVRRSGAPAAYTLWIFLLTGVPLAGWAWATRRAALGPYLRHNWPLGLAGGFGTLTSYGLALWVMTMAPVAIVAALRETSILFGTAIAGLVLKERVSALRIGAACVIAAGAIMLRLA